MNRQPVNQVNGQAAISAANDTVIVVSVCIAIMYYVVQQQSIVHSIRDRPFEESFPFDLDARDDTKARSQFRFTVAEIDHIVLVMDLPPTFTTDNRVTVSARVGLAYLLRRLAYPARLDDLQAELGRGRTTLSRIITVIALFITEKYRGLLYIHPTLNGAAIERFANIITNRWNPIQYVWGFIDGSKHYHARPTIGQRALYSGHKKQHCFSWQAVVTPDGLIACLFGPHPGHDNDAGMLRASNLLPTLALIDVINGFQHVLYGDAGYYCRSQMIVPFHQPTDPLQIVMNTEMSSMRQSVEHSFHLVQSNWAFITFKPNQKALLQPTGAYYALAVLFTNILTCVTGSNQISSFFGVTPMRHICNCNYP